MAASISSQLHC